MYYFIVNPNSRSGAGLGIWKNVKEVLDARGISYLYGLTRHPGHARSIAQKFTAGASADNPIRLIVLGGDGTIREVLSGVQDLRGILFGFIPAGSGNDFCRGMHLPTDPMEALEVILTFGRVQKMDVPVIHYGTESSRFGISCGIGYDAAVCHEVITSPLKTLFNRFHLGKLVYSLIALKQMMFIQPCKSRITTDDGRQIILKKMFFAAVMNQQYEGGGFRFAPDGRPDDGILDVIAVDGLSRLKMMAILPTAFWGGHTHFKGIHIFKCRSVKIECSHPSAVHIDGESGGIRSQITVDLEPVSIDIIIPDIFQK